MRGALRIFRDLYSFIYFNFFYYFLLFLIMSTKNDNKKMRPGSNAAFGRNNGVQDLMRSSAAIMASRI